MKLCLQYNRHISTCQKILSIYPPTNGVARSSTPCSLGVACLQEFCVRSFVEAADDRKKRTMNGLLFIHRPTDPRRISRTALLPAHAPPQHHPHTGTLHTTNSTYHTSPYSSFAVCVLYPIFLSRTVSPLPWTVLESYNTNRTQQLPRLFVQQARGPYALQRPRDQPEAESSLL